MSEATDWVKCWRCNHYQILPVRDKLDRCESCGFFLFNKKRGYFEHVDLEKLRTYNIDLLDPEAVGIGVIDPNL